MTEADILKLINDDKWMMEILHKAEDLNLPDWLIGAGFVRNKVWDYLHGKKEEGVKTNDIDLVYFDPDGNDEEADKKLSTKLGEETGIDWEVVNQSYTHLWHNVPSFKSSEDAIAHWRETATAIGVRLEKGKLKLVAPYGINDLVNLVVRKCPKFPHDIRVIEEKMIKNNWLTRWPKLKVEL